MVPGTVRHLNLTSPDSNDANRDNQNHYGDEDPPEIAKARIKSGVIETPESKFRRKRE